MARFGTWSPLAANWASQPALTTPDIICLHTMVGSLAGTDGMFRRNGFGGTFSHFGIGGDGSCTQWQDSAYRAAANYNGNHRIISVECADIGAPFASWNINDGSAVPAFTDAQCETLAQLIAAMCKAHNIPCVLIPDAKPGRRGVGYHRLGVPGYMIAGSEQWSTAQGKVCPGDRRIAQIPGVIARAQQILNGDDDMPLSAADKQTVKDAVWEVLGQADVLAEIGKAVVTAPLHSSNDKRGDWSLNDRIPAMDVATGTTLATVQTQTAALNALSSLVAQQNGLTVADVQKAVSDAIAKGVDVNVSVQPAANA